LTRNPIIVKWPLLKRNEGSRVVVKLNRRSVQWCTDKTVSSLKALMVDSGIKILLSQGQAQ
jgi:hypothetical protein